MKRIATHQIACVQEELISWRSGASDTYTALERIARVVGVDLDQLIVKRSVGPGHELDEQLNGLNRAKAGTSAK